jgi:CobQ-like glutamine amidotransferase family enzyme
LPDTTARRRIRLAHLYPDVMDLYGDRGNVVALARRCEWRGVQLEVVDVHVGHRVDFDDIDMVFIGGGQDTGQTHVSGDLVRRGAAIGDLVERGGAALAVCAGFQLFGCGYVTAMGRELPGIGVFDAHTLGGSDRIIGNVIVETVPGPGEDPMTLVGFENHSGRTYLAGGARPLGRIVQGGGNLGDASVEGAVYGNAIGTYLHGPLLPKNPELADRLIAAALRHRHGDDADLAPLDDALERRAHAAAIARIAELGDVDWPRMAG